MNNDEIATNGKYTIFVLEGLSREPKIFNEIQKSFFKKSTPIITLLTNGNIYMLYNELKADNNIDIFSLLRRYATPEQQPILKKIDHDNVAGIYLFYDCDLQHTESRDPVTVDVLAEMLEIFSDATSSGKLYISYPMVEALRDWVEGTCNTGTNCIIPIRDTTSKNDIGSYKRISGQRNANTDIRKYDENNLWNKVFENFLMRIGCLFDLGTIPSYKTYGDMIVPLKIFELQREKFIKHGEVFVLSAIPEFLLDRLKEDDWNEQVSYTQIKRGNCTRQVNW